VLKGALPRKPLPQIIPLLREAGAFLQEAKAAAQGWGPKSTQPQSLPSQSQRRNRYAVPRYSAVPRYMIDQSKEPAQG
jgi:hypothetical protein